MSTQAAPTAAQLNYNEAFKRASRHRAEVEASEQCGCFSCFRTFPPSTITRWIDGNQTALCPKCGIDTVLGSASMHGINDTFLRRLHLHLNAHRSK